MSFAAIITCVWANGRTEEHCILGRTRDGNPSSTTGELMALAVLAGLMPPDREIAVHCDSKAAIALAAQLADKMSMRDAPGKSNQEYLARLVQPWFRARSRPLRIKWVRAHAGTAQNEKADRAAKAAHHTPLAWSLRLGWEPTERRYRLHAGDAIAPQQPRRLCRSQDEEWFDAALTEQIAAARLGEERALLPAGRSRPDVPPEPPPPAISSATIRVMLQAINIAVDVCGGAHRKNAWRITNARDARTRSFNIKVLLRALPVANRQWVWYPEAYPEAEMRQCPIPGCSAIETQGHMFACPAHSWQTYTADDFDADLGKKVAEIAAETANARHAFPLLADDLLKRVTQAADDEAQAGKDDLELRRGRKQIPAEKYDTLVRELKERRARIPTLFVMQLAEKKYAWFKDRCELQVDREQLGPIHPDRRRRIMKNPNGRTSPNPRAEQDDGLPRWPRTTATRRDDMSKSYGATIRKLLLGPAARDL